MKKLIAVLMVMLVAFSLFAQGGKEDSKKVVIYHCISTQRADPINELLQKQFPDYEIVFEYMGLSNLAAKLKNEGPDTEIDIALDLGYVYLEDLKDMWEDHSSFKTERDMYQDFMQVSGNAYMPFSMYSGCVAINKDVFTKKGLKVPTSWEDLLDPQYKGLIEMPNPASSGTGYIFLKMLCELWGTDKAIAYFDKLAPNVLAFTSSGSAPLNALVTGECAIALCMTYQAANKITEGVNLQILEFDGGYPWTSDGAAIVKGHATPAVKEVFKYIYSTCVIEDMKLFTEHGFKTGDGQLKNFPQNIKYSNMGEDTLAAKEAILAKWKH